MLDLNKEDYLVEDKNNLIHENEYERDSLHPVRIPV